MHYPIQTCSNLDDFLTQNVLVDVENVMEHEYARRQKQNPVNKFHLWY